LAFVVVARGLAKVGPYVAKSDHDLILDLLVWEGAFARHVTL